MELSVIPVQNKFILYRPLLHVAFVGNKAMVDMATKLLSKEFPLRETRTKAAAFLNNIGFLNPDPTPPLHPGIAFLPTTVVLLLTTRCHLRCVYCYAKAGEVPSEDMSLHLAKTGIDEVYRNATNMGQASFDLSFHGGGEPTLAWETLRAAVEHARSKPLRCQVTLTSNGVWSKDRRDWLIANLDNLSLSVDGDRETQDRQRPFASGRGSFKKVIETIEALDRSSLPYGIRMTAIAPWGESLAKDIRFLCEETGCQTIQVEPAFNTARGERQFPTKKQAKAFVDGFMAGFEIAERAHRNLFYSAARPGHLTRVFCYAPYNALVIGPTGELTACYEVTNPNHPLASVSRLGRVENGLVALDQQARDTLLVRMAERQELCRNCFCYWHCAGDCYSRSFSSSLDSHKFFGNRCVMNRQLTTQLLLWRIMNGNGVWQGNPAQNATFKPESCEQCTERRPTAH